MSIFFNCDTSKLNKTEINFMKYVMEADPVKYELREKRTHQDVFREKLIERYGVCVISKNNEKRCDACHIIPFSECENIDSYNVNNGILMDSGIHKLYDAYLLSIHPETLRVVIKNKTLKEDPNIAIYNGVKTSVSDKSIKYLRMHYNIFKNSK